MRSLFWPMSAALIYNVIDDAYKNKSLMEIKVNKGFQRVKEFPEWNQVVGMYIY